MTDPDLIIGKLRSEIYECGNLLKLHFGQPIDVELKEDGTEITSADLEVERHLRNFIESEFPGSNIIGEEETSTNNEGDLTWVIDPIDGTRYFSNAVPLYAITVGILEENIPRIGLIYFPELEIFLHAIRGSGAYRNGQIIQKQKSVALSDSIVYMDMDNLSKLVDEELSWTTHLLNQIMLNVSENRIIGSSTFATLSICSGVINAFIDITGRNPVWDMLAQTVIMEEIGFERKEIQCPFSPENNRVILARPELITNIFDKMEQ